MNYEELFFLGAERPDDTYELRELRAALRSVLSAAREADSLKERIHNLNRDNANLNETVKQQEQLIREKVKFELEFAQDRADYAARLLKENAELRREVDRLKSLGVPEEQEYRDAMEYARHQREQVKLYKRVNQELRNRLSLIAKSAKIALEKVDKN